MSSDVVLTAALRNNLLSLQNTQRSIDTTQLRLATGLKVNSALDNPQNFFTAQSLNNRANDLSRLLDGINLSIRTIEETDKGLTALTSLVEQAQSIVNSARDELASSEGEARAVGTVDLSSESNLVTFSANIDDGDEIVITTTDDSGNQISETVAINAPETADTLAAKITNAFADNQNGEIIAEINSSGFLSVESTDGRTFRLSTTGANTLALGGFQDLGLGRFFQDETRTTGTLPGATIVAGSAATSISLFEASGDTIESGDLIVNTQALIDDEGNTVVSGFAAGDSIQFIVDTGSTTQTSSFSIAATSTYQDLVDSVNQDANLNELIQLEFDDVTGQITLRSLSDTVENATLDVQTAGAATFDIGLGDGTGNLDPIGVGAFGAQEQFVFSFNTSTGSLETLASDFNEVRNQIDRIVVDANFRGLNLLNGDNLQTFFNEDFTSSLTITGATFTADGLGITQVSFNSSDAIELSADQVQDAIASIRSFSSSVANGITIIQTRRDFTEETINTLSAGADDLTVADQNEEGANLLALQTRQQLGVTSLALAAQSQQAVLRLF